MSTKASSSTYSNSFYHHSDTTRQHRVNETTTAQNLYTEVSSDLHLKMLKKIAQLTKVIYSLNTKNDEHENVLANLRVQFNEEKELIVQETTRKLEDFKQKVSLSNDQNKQVELLKLQIKDLQQSKSQLEQDLNDLKLASLKREQSLGDSHSQEINEMNRQLEILKTQIDLQLSEFKETYLKFEQEKLYSIEDLKSKHRLEIESLKQSFISNKDCFAQEKVKLDEQHKHELNKLNSLVDDLKKQNQLILNENELNIVKLKMFHAKELEALTANSNQEYLNNLNALKNELDQIKREKFEIESEFKQKLDCKLEELVEKEEEIDGLKQALSSINKNLESSIKDLNTLSEDFMQTKIEKEKALKKLMQLQSESNELTDKFDQQAIILNDKTNYINQLEGELTGKSTQINDLQSELKLIKSQLSSLENDKKQLESLSSNQSETSLNQIKTLKNKLQELQRDQKTLQENHAKLLETMRQSHTDEIDKLNFEIKLQKEKIVDEYETKITSERAQLEEKLLTLERNHKRDFNVETQKLVKERDRLQRDLSKITKELSSKTKQHEDAIEQLNANLSLIKDNLEKSTNQVGELTSENTNLRQERDELKRLLEKSTNELNLLKDEHKKLSLAHEELSKDAQIETKAKLEKLTKELNEKWSQTLKNETQLLKRELLSTTEKEHRLAIETLVSTKDDEINSLKITWQTNINLLLDEISQLKKQSNQSEVDKRKEIDLIRSDLNEENHKLRFELEKVEENYRKKFDDLELLYSSDKSKIIETLNRENELKLNEQKTKYYEDLQAQMLAHRTAVSSMRQAWEKNKQLEFEVKDEEFKKEIEFVKNDLQQVHYCEIDDLKRAFDKELLASKMEVDRSLELLKLKELDTKMRRDEYETDLALNQKSIASLNKELEKLNKIIDNLKHELNARDQEVEQIKFDAQNDLINKENNLKRLHLDEFNQLNVENQRQKQTLVSEFRQAQEILKARIIELQNELKELKERHESRESRQEDLDLIRNLRQVVKDRDEYLKKLEDEKKYFKMELVNRETNFNKMFNNTPNIGVMNPLGNSKKKSTSNGKISPAQQRLDPIPGGSPFHEQMLNPNRPLPKKFL